MSLKEIAFLVNWVREDYQLVELVAANLRWTPLQLQKTLHSLEKAAINKMEEESVAASKKIFNGQLQKPQNNHNARKTN